MLLFYNLFVIGNSIRSTPIKKPNYRDKIDDFPRDIQAIKQLDDLLYQLAVRIRNKLINNLFLPLSGIFIFQLTIDVQIMPGEFDPADRTLPQQAFHKCLFPKVNINTFSTLNIFNILKTI